MIEINRGNVYKNTSSPGHEQSKKRKWLTSSIILACTLSLVPSISSVYAENNIEETIGNEQHYAKRNGYYNKSTVRQDFFQKENDVVVGTNQNAYVPFMPSNLSSWMVNWEFFGLSGLDMGGLELKFNSKLDYNAMVGKIYNPKTGKLEYQILYAVNNTMTSATIQQGLSAYLKAAIFQTPEFQNELYAKIAAKDSAGIKDLMSKYLPQIYMVKLSTEELKKAQELLDKTDVDDFVTDPLNSYLGEIDTALNEYMESHADASKQIDVAINFKADTTQTVPSSTDKNYAYDKKSVASGMRWAPADRALTVGSSLTGKYTMPQYWISGEDGVTPGKESNNPAFGDAYKKDLPPVDYGDGSDRTPLPEADLSMAAKLPGAKTVISVNTLTTGKNSMIDLSHANTSHLLDGRFDGDWGVFTGQYTDKEGVRHDLTVEAARTMTVDKAILGENTTFRLGIYGQRAHMVEGQWLKDEADTVMIREAVQANSANGQTPLKVQLGYVPDLHLGRGFGFISYAPYDFNEDGSFKSGTGDAPFVLGIYKGADHFVVSGETSRADGIFNVYTITPEVGKYDHYFKDEKENYTGAMWYLKGYTWQNTGEIGESGKTAADETLSMQNLWRAFNDRLFRRSADLHRRYSTGEKGKQASGVGPAEKENIWAEAWHGRFNSSSGWGRKVGQTYDGLTAGYDKELAGTYGGGKAYAGAFITRITTDASLNQGKADQDAMGLGFYGTWAGPKGHYVDASLSGLRLSDDFYFQGPLAAGGQGMVRGKYSKWAYGAALQYGKRNDRGSFWWDPHASLYFGHMDDVQYKLNNGLGIDAGSWDSLVGRLGITAGKSLPGDKGRIYAGVSMAHEFNDGQSAEQFWGGYSTNEYFNKEKAKIYERQRAASDLGGRDTWWEMNLGGDLRFSENSRFHGEYTRNFGKTIGNDWSVSGRLEFAWNGVGGGKKTKSLSVVKPVTAVRTGQNETAGVVLGKVKKTNQPEGVKQPTAISSKTALPSLDRQSGMENIVPGIPVVKSAVSAVDNGQASTDYEPAGTYELEGVTVESARPDWEKNLSPGQVSVIYPEAFAGEQKDLPDLLDRIPGLFIDQQNGEGHYTTARIRGSSAAQVDVYIDGARMNLNGDAAVNLAAIPADNVERIEVYRGYVPARFMGAPLGGAINIVTKKPTAGKGYITQGMSSYGGWRNTYEYSMPLGSGSLMMTYGRTMWDGDFPFKYYDYGNIHRYSNGYSSSDGMVKWQDDHWIFKSQWRKSDEELATAVNRIGSFPGDKQQYSKIKQEYKEFYVGRRDTWNNLDVNWHVAYINSEKIAGGFGTRYNTKKWDTAINLAYRLWDSHLLEFNAAMVKEKLDAEGDNSVHGSYTKYDFVPILPRYRNSEYHLALQDTMSLNDAGDLKFTVIGRADKVKMDGMWEDISEKDQKWMYSGSVALQKQIDDKWNVKTTWGNYYRHPNFYEIFGDGAQIIQSKFLTLLNRHGFTKGTWESGDQFDFSVNHQGKMFGADADTVLTWYQRTSRNQLYLYTPNGVTGAVQSYYVPSGLMNVHGVELAQHMKWNRLGLSLAATWQKGKSRNTWNAEFGHFENGNQAFVPEWVVNARLDYTFPGDRFSLFGEYQYHTKEVLMGSASSGEGNTYGLIVKDPYSTINVGAKYRFDGGIRLTAGVNDLLNAGYDVQGYMDSKRWIRPINYPLPGRMYYATMEYSF